MARYRDAKCRLCRREGMKLFLKGARCFTDKCAIERRNYPPGRSEEHTSELQSQSNLVCRLLLEKKKKEQTQRTHHCSYRLSHSRARSTKSLSMRRIGRSTT